jgi:hypothetical protein
MTHRTPMNPLLACLLLVAAAPACAPADELASNQSDEASELRTSSTYFRFRPDQRRCVSPLCGGVWVSRVNHSTMRCADGSTRTECYVADADYTALGLSDRALPEFESRAAAGQAVLEGRIEARVFGQFGSLGHFVVTAGWQAATEAAPTGTFYRAQSNAVRCLAAPCPTIDEDRLNSSAQYTVTGLDLSTIAGATAADVAKGNDYLSRAPGILVAGVNRVIPNAGPAGRGTTLVASQYYLRVSAGVPGSLFCEADTECAVTAYSRPVASSADCYCAICAITPLNVSTASQYQAEWTRYCGSRHMICPLIRCLAPSPARCVNHACVAAPTTL